MKSKINLARKILYKILHNCDKTNSALLGLIDILQLNIEIQFDTMVKVYKTQRTIIVLLSINLIISAMIFYKLWR